MRLSPRSRAAARRRSWRPPGDAVGGFAAGERRGGGGPRDAPVARVLAGPGGALLGGSLHRRWLTGGPLRRYRRRWRGLRGGLGLAVTVGEAGAEVHRLQLVLDLPERLRGAQEEVPLGRQELRHLRDHPALERPAEVDEHVAHQHQVALGERQREGGVGEVQRLVGDARAQAGVELEELPAALEPALEEVGRDLRHRPLAVEPLPGAGQRLLVEVGRHDGPGPAGERRLLGQQHGHRRRLLPPRAGRRPDPQMAGAGAGSREAGKHPLQDDVELLRRAEEVGLLDGDQRDQRPPLGVDLAGGERPHVLVEAGEAHHLRPPLRQLLQEAEPGGGDDVPRRLADEDDELLQGGGDRLGHGRTRLRPAALAS